MMSSTIVSSRAGWFASREVQTAERDLSRRDNAEGALPCHVFVVEDENEICELLRYNLVREGYRVTCINRGDEALRRVKEESPDLIVLDLLLPGVDGMEVCRALKEQPASRQIPIIMLTAKNAEADIVAGLELGADDYIVKPFSPRVVVARIRAVLRRAAARRAEESGPVLRIHDLVIHPGRHEVWLGGEPLELTPTEFRVLCFLARRPGWVYSRAQIAEAVHGGEQVVTDRAVDVQIAGLRKKLGRYAEYVETVRGVGYRFRSTSG